MRFCTFIILWWLALSASAYERCFLDRKADGTSSCFIPAHTQTYSCIGSTKDHAVSCVTKNAQPVDCVLKEGRWREPKEIWCDSPAITLSANPIFSVVSGERTRVLARSDTTSGTSNAPVPTENCDAMITVDKRSIGYSRQYADKVRCLERRAVIEKAIPYENCAAMVGVPGSIDELKESRNRQDCLDRQAGIPVAPRAPIKQPMNCVPNYIGGMICN